MRIKPIINISDVSTLETFRCLFVAIRKVNAFLPRGSAAPTPTPILSAANNNGMENVMNKGIIPFAIM